MPKPPKLPAKEIIERIEARLARYDRGPFQENLARALACGPSASAWRSLAKRNPEKWAQAVGTMAKAAGFAERTESLSVTLDPQTLASELVARHGPEQASRLLQAAGLPSTLIGEVPGQSQGVTIECRTDQTTAESAIESGIPSKADS